MSEVFLGQIMLTGFSFAPKGFALCNGQTLPISQNQALFSLLGINYGGNGVTTFLLPDLRSRTPVGSGSSVDPSWQPSPYNIGDRAGVENVTLLQSEMPQHTHIANGTTAPGTTRNPSGTLYGSNSADVYAPSSGQQVVLSNQTVSLAGGNQPHTNLQPYDTISFSIALQGIFPSRN